MTPTSIVATWIEDARERTFALVEDLADHQLMGPCLPIVNPARWEMGHVAWFQEKWVLQHAAKQSPIWPNGDALYDSAAVAHDSRWSLPLPSRADTLAYMKEVRRRVLARLEQRPAADELYFVLLSVFHEDMHDEAFAYTRQTLGYPAPTVHHGDGDVGSGGAGPCAGDAAVPGGSFLLGAEPDGGFVFDNEKWAHPVEVQPFNIARAATTQSEFAAFVDDGGYQRRELWSADGWQWRTAANAHHPIYWRRSGRGWSRRQFDQWLHLEPHQPVLHVSWYEADAYCRWAGRRLPSEVEWEVAASAEPTSGGSLSRRRRRRYPWGDEPPTPRHAHLDGGALGCVDVGAHADGDSAFGCRQMMGNVWEWTSSTFLPYPGFVKDPYEEYSEPWFGTHKVLRGGCLFTRARLLRNTWRNFYTPDRCDIWSGFRTCAA